MTPKYNWSKLRNASCSPRCLSAILFLLVPREVREFNTCVFCVLPSRGPFQPMKRCENCLIPRGRFQFEDDELLSVRLKEDTSFYFNLKTFPARFNNKVFLTSVSDIFLNLSFDLLVFSPLFVYLNKLDRSPFDHALTLIRFVSVIKIPRLFALKSPLYVVAVTSKLYGTDKHDISQDQESTR